MGQITYYYKKNDDAITIPTSGVSYQTRRTDSAVQDYIIFACGYHEAGSSTTLNLDVYNWDGPGYLMQFSLTPHSFTANLNVFPMFTFFIVSTGSKLLSHENYTA